MKPSADASIYLAVPGTAKGTGPINRLVNQPVCRPSLSYYRNARALGRKKSSFGVRRSGSEF